MLSQRRNSETLVEPLRMAVQTDKFEMSAIIHLNSLRQPIVSKNFITKVD